MLNKIDLYYLNSNVGLLFSDVKNISACYANIIIGGCTIFIIIVLIVLLGPRIILIDVVGP